MSMKRRQHSAQSKAMMALEAVKDGRRKPVSLKPHPWDRVPEETARVARAIFPKGKVYMRMRDVFGPLYTDEAFGRSFRVEVSPPKPLAAWHW